MAHKFMNPANAERALGVLREHGYFARTVGNDDERVMRVYTKDGQVCPGIGVLTFWELHEDACMLLEVPAEGGNRWVLKEECF